MTRAWATIGALAVLAVGPLLAGPSGAATDDLKCEAAKLKIAGKYSFCRLKAEAKAVKTGELVDYTKCDGNYGLKWGTAETNGAGRCPTTGDQTDIRDQITADADFIALKLTGVRFVDNGDGTVTDLQTGLMWEKKDNLGGIHDWADNSYTWSASAPGAPDGTAFTTFLGTLNNGTSADGTTISGCFAGHCDWRLPTIAELQTILLEPYPCSTNPCIDPIFGPTLGVPSYWSATTDAGDPSLVWVMEFVDGYMFRGTKATIRLVRAVRGGL